MFFYSYQEKKKPKKLDTGIITANSHSITELQWTNAHTHQQKINHIHAKLHTCIHVMYADKRQILGLMAA